MDPLVILFDSHQRGGYNQVAKASKVAERINGMHVYGWSISSKMVSYGWTSIRSGLSRERVFRNQEHVGRGGERVI